MRAFSGALMIFFLSSLPAQEIQVPNRDWVWGISQFTGLDLAPEDSRILENIPGLIAQQLGEIDQHLLRGEEIDTLLAVAKQEEVRSKRNKVSELLAQLNKDFFEQKLSSQQKEDLERELQEAREALARTEALDSPQQGSVLWEAQRKIIGDSGILALEGQGPPRLAKAQGIDYLIFGRIRRIEDYIRMEILGYNSILDQQESLLTDSFPAEDLADRVVQWTGRLRTRLLGRPWGGVNLTVTPADAAILRDGEVVAYGTLSLVNEEPGPLTLEVVRLGYQSQELVLDILPETLLEEEIILSSLEDSRLAIATTPPGADIYLGSQWLGKTPYQGEAPSVDSQLTLILPGYFNGSLFVPAFEDTEADLILIQRSQRQTLQEAKDDFYTSLGWFTLSFFGSMMVTDLHSSLLSQYQYYLSVNPGAEFQAQRNVSLTMERTGYWTMLGMWTVTGGLFGLTLWELVEYIQTGEENYQ
jgi:hypothetical protein